MTLESQYNLVIIEGKATYERITASLRDAEPEEAIRQLQNFLKIYPEFAQAHNDVAVYYYQAGNTLKALAHYEKAHKLSPRNITFLKNLADFYIVELDWTDDAIHIYLDILKDNPFDIEVLNALGSVSRQIGRREPSRQYYNRALQLDPNSRDAHMGLQLLEQQSIPAETSSRGERNTQAVGRLAPAMPLLQSSSAAPPQAAVAATSPPAPPVKSPAELYRAAIDLAEKGNRGEAIQLLEVVVAAEPANANAHNDLAVLCQQEGNNEAALTHQEKAAALAPENTVYQKNLADHLAILFGQYEKAMQIYVNLLSKSPRDVELLKAIAHICLELDQPDNARHFLQQVLSIQPWDRDARSAVKELAELQEKGRVLAPAPAAIKSPAELYAEVQQLVKEEKSAEARKKLEELVRLNPSDALAANDLGVLLYQSGEIDGARACYEKAAELNPGNSAFRKNLADLYFVELGRTDEAIAIYLDLLKQQPRNIETLESLGLICTALGQTTEARTFYRRALEIEPWNAQIRGALQKLV